MARALTGHLRFSTADGPFSNVPRLPPYAPEFNPVEAIWAYLKKHEIASLCPQNLAEVSSFARRCLKSMQPRPKLIRAFRQQAELAL
jgi:transposase